MEEIALTVYRRNRTGKGAARALRRQGQLPGVLYGKGEALPITLERREVLKKVDLRHMETTLIRLTLKDPEAGKEEERRAILRELQTDPVSGEPLHVDLFEVALEEAIRVSVPLRLEGSPVGVRKGGILEFFEREIEVECLPTQIPDEIRVPIDSLDIGDHISAGDLQLPEGVRLAEDPELVVVAVAPPTVSEEVEAAAPEETPEPEVVRKPAKEEQG